MSQFALYRNRNPASKTRFPLLLDIQSDLLEGLATRVVVPLALASAARARSMRTLTPILKFEGKEFLMMTPASRRYTRARAWSNCRRSGISPR
jgi:toxin CcdB